MDKKFCNEAMGKAAEVLRKRNISKEEFNNSVKAYFATGGEGSQLSKWFQDKYKFTKDISDSLAKTANERIQANLQRLQAQRAKNFQDILGKSEAGKVLKPEILKKIAQNLADPKTGILTYSKMQEQLAKTLGKKLYSDKTMKELAVLSKEYRKLEDEIVKINPKSAEDMVLGKQSDLIFKQQTINAEIEAKLGNLEKPRFSEYAEALRYNTNMLADLNTVRINIGGGVLVNLPKFADVLSKSMLGSHSDKKLFAQSWKRAGVVSDLLWKKGIYVDPVLAKGLRSEGRATVEFKGKYTKWLNAPMRAVQIGLAVPDYLTYDFAMNQTLLRDMKDAKVKVPTEEMLENARLEAEISVMRDKDRFLGMNGSEILNATAEAINKISPTVTLKGKEYKLNLGNKLLPFTNVLGNLMGRQITGGIIRGVWELANLDLLASTFTKNKKLSISEVNKRWRRIHEGLGDAGGLLAVGIAYNAGVIVPMALNYEEERTMAAIGMKEGSIKSGNLYYDFLSATQPFDFKAKALMRLLEAQRRIKDATEFVADPKAKGKIEHKIYAQSLLRLSQDPIFNQLAKNVQAAGFKTKGQTEGMGFELFAQAVEGLANTASQYIPFNRPIFKNASNFLFNRNGWSFNSIETYDPNPLKRTWNRFLSSYGVGDKKFGVSGTELKRLYTLNPVFNISKDRKDEIAKEILSVQRKSSEAIIDPMPRTVQGQKLTAEEWKKGNEYLGKSRAYFVGSIMNEAWYTTMQDPKEKAFILDQIEKASKDMALLTSIGKPLPKSSIGGKLGRIVQAEMDKETKSRAIGMILLRQLAKSKRPKADKTKQYEVEELKLEEN